MSSRLKILIIATVALTSLLLGGAQPAQAQLSGSISAFSPFTMYGLGDMAVGGNAKSRGMGGIGVAMRDSHDFNYLNPASLSAIPQQSAIFSFGLLSSNYYTSTGGQKAAYNSVDMNDLGFAMPLTKGLGLGVSLAPLSSVGYNTAIINNNPSVVENIGRALYTYYGDGGASQVNLSIGGRIGAGLSLGATMHYAFGSIQRSWNSTLYSTLTDQAYSQVRSTENIYVNKLLFTAAMQYQARVGKDDMLTFGLTYQPKMKANLDQERLTTSADQFALDTVLFAAGEMQLTFPEKITAGVYFNNQKFGVGFDYIRQDWKNAFETPTHIALGVVNDFRLGAQYTHDKNNFRSFFSRITYRAGLRYSTSYLTYEGQQLNDMAVSIGFEFPFKRGSHSNINVALEYGQRGNSQTLIKEQYFRALFGLKIFASDDLWFVKRKYN